ncbi:MAG: 5' nucleotidase, NT5C type [Planctomycetota bacterium]
MSRRKIFLDLDGVIIDFVLPTMAHYDAFIRDETEYPEDCLWDIVKATNIIRKRNSIGGITLTPIEDSVYWRRLEYAYWRNLKQYPLAPTFVRWLQSRGDVFLCTSPFISGGHALAARYDWCQEHYPELAKTIVLTPAKELLATHHEAILIDDSDRNVDRFNEAAEQAGSGATAILVPRPWNLRGTAIPGHPYDVVADDLRALDKKLIGG